MNRSPSHSLRLRARPRRPRRGARAAQTRRRPGAGPDAGQAPSPRGSARRGGGRAPPRRGRAPHARQRSTRSTRSASSTSRPASSTAAIPHLERARALDPAHYANGYDLALAYLETGAARRRAPAGAADARGEGDRRAAQPARRRRRARRATSSPPPSAISAPRTWTPTEEHLFDWGDNLLQPARLRRRRRRLHGGHPPPSDVGAAAHRPRHRAGTRAASTRRR